MKTILSSYCVNNRRVAYSLSLLVLLGLSGCASIEPWVKPYERDKLADPIMAFGRCWLVLPYLAFSGPPFCRSWKYQPLLF